MDEGQLENNANISSWDHLQDDDDDLLLVNDDLNLNTSSLRSDERYAGFDNNVGDTWIYPSNFPERAYQYNIIQKALFHNTLVVLPTGLGKTFIAAVVMYNMYRWYPMGKVIFMAPTRPLVAQHMSSCKIVGIPKADSVEITGKLSKSSRAQLWQSKRVFFATPQSVQSDVMDAELNFPFQAIKLIVVDEAHRAKGRYAYTDVVSYIWQKNKFFRILALSATPGRRKDDVEEVIRNLFISHIEVRTEDSVDVVSYVHKRQMKTVVVQLGPKLTKIRDELLAIADPHIRNLIDNRLISGRPGSISRNWLVMEHKKFRDSLVNNRVVHQKELNSDFSICISVYHAIELLERHGLRVFLNNFDESQDGGAKFVVILRPDLRRLIEKVREEAGPNPFAYSDQCMVNGEIATIPANLDFGHPKFEIARDHVLTHFEHNKNSRVIIFCEYRESVMLMHRLLLQHRPLIRPRVFVGQGGTGSIRAVTQQQQIKVMNDFRSGESNVLIATSVAEEGIDVGEVDLIVCFDINTTNPIRFIQRIGRTGRKKEGKVLLLATEGKEYTILKEVLSERNKLNKSISRGGEFASSFYKYSPRMVPTEFNPKCQKTFITPTEEPEPTTTRKKQPTLNSLRIPKIGQKRDLRHFFKQKVLLNDEERSVFEDSPALNSSKSNTSVPNTTSTSIQDGSEVIMDFSPPKVVGISNKIAKKIAKYVRNGSKVQTIDVQKAITTNKISKESLQFLLDFSPDLLQNVWTHMQGLWAKGINENNLPLKGISVEDRQSVRVYLQILNVFGSKENFASVLEKRRDIQKDFNSLNLLEKYGFPLNDECQDNFEFIRERFEKMSNLFLPDKSSIDSTAQSMVYDEEEDEIENNTTSFNDDCIMDSKYMSQWEDPSTHTEYYDESYINESPRPSTSVRIKNNKEKDLNDVVFVGVAQQSTPIRTSTLKQATLNFGGSPIVSAAPKGQSKVNSSTKRSQKNSLDFIKSFPAKRKNTEFKSPKESLFAENQNKRLDLSKENDMDFFDDQFDAIIAANSGIIESIEKAKDGGQKKTNSQALNNSIQQRKVEDFSCVSSAALKKAVHRSAPIDIITSTATNPKTNLDSTPEDITDCLIDDSHKNNKAESSLCTIRSTTVDGNTAAIPETTDDPANDIRCSVHPELVDIDINNFSEAFSDDIETSHNSPQRASPDIFDELSEPIPEPKTRETSPINTNNSSPKEDSPCLLTKKALTWRQVQQKYGKPSQSESSFLQQDDSVIQTGSKIGSKRRIISSDSDSSQNNPPSPRTSRVVTTNSQPSNARLHRKRFNEFIDVISGSDSEDEFEDTIGCYMADSVVVPDHEVENDMVNMTGVYLQSVKSPSGRGVFKIPAHRQYNDASKIFSRVPDDNGSYMDDSFVVSDEESDVDQTMCPLERAEQILKAQRRAKRKAKLITGHELKQPAKKKRILRIHNSSEDDDDFV